LPDAQLPRVPPHGPIGTSILHEDERVRIWETLLEPGQELPMHEHLLPYVVVCIEGADNTQTALDGTVRELHERPGHVVVRDPAVHKLENVGTTRYRNRLIELKSEVR
jgi:quercetin dioxygenase-like cupin family protein